jgi:hypothetical protein
MGKRKGEWMDTEYVLSYFGENRQTARGAYDSYVKEGIELGRRPELVGGGLIRSLGGWKAVRESRLEKGERIKGDQRILGDSGFVLGVLKEAEEKVERKYELKWLGYGLGKVEARVCEIFSIDKEDLYSRSRQKDKSNARALFCYWAVEELGYTQNEMAKRLGMTQPGVGYSVHRGKAISKLKRYTLID